MCVCMCVCGCAMPVCMCVRVCLCVKNKHKGTPPSSSTLKHVHTCTNFGGTYRAEASLSDGVKDGHLIAVISALLLHGIHQLLDLDQGLRDLNRGGMSRAQGCECWRGRPQASHPDLDQGLRDLIRGVCQEHEVVSVGGGGIRASHPEIAATHIHIYIYIYIHTVLNDGRLSLHHNRIRQREAACLTISPLLYEAFSQIAIPKIVPLLKSPF